MRKTDELTFQWHKEHHLSWFLAPRGALGRGADNGSVLRLSSSLCFVAIQQRLLQSPSSLLVPLLWVTTADHLPPSSIILMYCFTENEHWSLVSTWPIPVFWSSDHQLTLHQAHDCILIFCHFYLILFECPAPKLSVQKTSGKNSCQPLR